VKKILIVLFSVLLLTGCGCSKKEIVETEIGNNIEDKTVVQNQIFDGLEFVNLSAKDGVIKTIIINNTGYVYEGSKIEIRIMDENGTVIAEEIDEVNDPMDAGTTKELVTNTNADLSKAVSVEYSIVFE
jgi:hypothetical protein